VSSNASSPQLHPYASLTPDGRMLSLNSYENRVYLVYLETPYAQAHAQVVVKFYRPNRWSRAQILEEHAFAHELEQGEVPMVAPLEILGTTLNQFEEFSFSVSPRCGGRTPELDQPQVLERIGRFIARMHVVGRASPFATRPTLDIDTFGYESREFLLASDMIPPELIASWRAIADQALEAVAATFQRVGKVNHIRLHGDCHPGNILWTEDRGNQTMAPGPHFVDLDDARMGPAVQDFWMLLSGDEQEIRSQVNELLKGYEDFLELDDRELALIEPLRTLRLITILRGSQGVGQTPLFLRPSLGSIVNAIGKIGFSNFASKSVCLAIIKIVNRYASLVDDCRLINVFHLGRMY
jgi:Ser/Thr protein kinase RdoA (MazF antagonist)